ncbi:Gfo/Idh/MocA family oxidoreductase [Cystobacter fuscus]|uniref:Gfo/Idh/MocA family protein n=1 Tax=Cystobacter fuscus TaxID=43 RepID=UPI002B27EA68|nr:Gfo/Idh/MocA family oxidoreductase [Cystobacter fuscus]
MDQSLRLGLLGAARITPFAIMRSLPAVPSVRATAVAARDATRAHEFARRHGIPKVHTGYQALLDDPEVDAIYNPLPNSLHAEWTIRALDAGKHVLCEKPLASNADEAVRMAEAARRNGRVLMEAFHYRFHPLMARVLEVLRAGEIGRIEHVHTAMCIPLPLRNDIRFRLDLAGGATMDVGSYALHMLRTVTGKEPRVGSARATLRSPGVDRAMEADFTFEDGSTGSMECSLWSRKLLKISIQVRGSEGWLSVFNPTMPQLYHHLTVVSRGQKRRERIKSEGTYTHQLRQFASVVRRDATPLVTLEDSIANMRLIDAVYRAAGLEPRAHLTV